MGKDKYEINYCHTRRPEVRLSKVCIMLSAVVPNPGPGDPRVYAGFRSNQLMLP